MTANPTGAENAQVQDDAGKRAQEVVNTAQNLLVAIGNPPNINDDGFCGCGECPQCLLDCAHQSVEELLEALREAEQRGMMRAVGYLKGAGKQHRELVPVLLKTNPAMAEMQKIRAEECEGNAQAIERAAKED